MFVNPRIQFVFNHKISFFTTVKKYDSTKKENNIWYHLQNNSSDFEDASKYIRQGSAYLRHPVIAENKIPQVFQCRESNYAMCVPFLETVFDSKIINLRFSIYYRRIYIYLYVSLLYRCAIRHQSK